MPGRRLPLLLLSTVTAALLSSSPAHADEPAVGAAPPPAYGAPRGCRWRAGGRRCQDPLALAVMISVMSSAVATGTAVNVYNAARTTDDRSRYIAGSASLGALAVAEAAVAGWMFYDHGHPLWEKVARPLVTISPAGASLGLVGSF